MVTSLKFTALCSLWASSFNRQASSYTAASFCSLALFLFSYSSLKITRKTLLVRFFNQICWIMKCKPVRDDSFDNISRSQWVSTFDYLKLADLFRVLKSNRVIIKIDSRSKWNNNMINLILHHTDQFRQCQGKRRFCREQPNRLWSDPWALWSRCTELQSRLRQHTRIQTNKQKQHLNLFIVNLFKNHAAFQLTLHAKTLNVLSWTFIIG